jgi:hypothetical protein
MKRFLKKIMLFGIVPLLFCQTFEKQSLPSTKKNVVNPIRQNSLSLSSVDNQLQNFKVYKTTKPVLSDFQNKYDYFYYSDNGLTCIVADALSSNSFINGIFEIKLILRPRSYHFDFYPELSKEKYVVETITSSNSALEKRFYVPTIQETTTIINKAQKVSSNSDEFKRIITSLNVEFDYKASLPNISLCSTVNYASHSGDSQAILDDYLKRETNGNDSDQIQVGFGGESITTYNGTDDTITNLIPKSVFKTDGTYSKNGSEWGYFAKTYNDTQNNKITSLLIYDIFNQRTDSIVPDITSVKTVLHRNYKYNYDSNTVSKDVINNYCIGNPSLRIGLKYVTLQDDRNAVAHKNYNEKGYNIDDDNGYCIGSTSIKYIGVGKNSDKGNIGDIQKAVVFLGNIVLTVATSGMSLGAQIAIGAAYSMITDTAISYSQKTQPDLTSQSETGKIVKESTNILGYTNFEKARDDCKEEKHSLYNYEMLSIDSNSDQKEKVPYLFKDSSDSANYKTQLYSPYGYNNYTACFAHSFHAEVINDNSIFVVRWNPEHIGTINANWSYLVGKDVNSQPIDISDGSDNYYLSYGINHPQELTINPPKTGKYIFVLQNMQSGTTMKIGTNNITSTKKYWTDAWGSSNYESKEKSITIEKNLIKGNTYHVFVNRPTSGGLFGTAKLNVYLEDEYGSIATGSSSSGHNYTFRPINYKGFAICSEFKPLSSGQYTFVLSNNATSKTSDTFVTLLNTNHQEIISDDDGFGDYRGGVRAYLNQCSSDSYFIISRPFSVSIMSDFELDVFKESFIPEMKGKIMSEAIYIPDLRAKKNAYFLTSQSVQRTITFSASLDYSPATGVPSVTLSIRDSTLKTIATNSNILSNSIKVTLDEDVLYEISISSTDSKLLGGINLLCR